MFRRIILENFKMRRSLLLLPLLTISCGMSEEQRQAQLEAQYKHDLQSAQQQCVNFGYNVRSELFSFCVQTQYKAIIDGRRAEYERRMAGWQAVADAGRAMQGATSESSTSTQPGRINTVNSIGGTRLLCRRSPNPNEMYCR